MRCKLILLAALFLSVPAHAALEVETTGLGHGVKAWYASNPRVPVVDVVLSFEGAGSASDPAGKEGRAAFAAALFNEGAGDMDSVSFQRALEEKAISLSAEVEADRLKIHVRCLREDVVRAGELLTLAIANPRIDSEAQARMRTEIQSMLRQQEESAGYQSGRQLAMRAFAGHPYANPTDGTQVSLAALSGDDVRAFYKTYLTRNNVLVSAAGDVDSSVLDQMLGSVIDALQESDAAPAITPANVQAVGELLRTTMPVPQTVVTFMAPWVARDDKRFYASYLLNYVLGGDPMQSRLSALRKKGGLVYGASTDLDIRLGGSYLVGQLATRNQSAEEAIAQTKAILSEISQKGISTEECADAKSYVIGSNLRKLDASGSISAMLLAMQVHKLGEDFLLRRSALFEAAKCTEMDALAAEYLKPERFLFSVVGGGAEIASPAAPIAANKGAAQ